LLSLMEALIRSRVAQYRAKGRSGKSAGEEGTDETTLLSEPKQEENEAESRFNSALSTLLAENSWKLVTSRSGRYKVQFKPSLDYKDRINILEIVMEDIRERYMDLKENLQRSQRKNRKRKRTKRGKGS